MGAHSHPGASTLPIPRDVVPGPGWTAQMREMAEIIGAYETLLLSDRHGGEEYYIPADATRNPFRPLIGAARSRALSRHYGRERITIPFAAEALRRARRGAVVASVRCGALTIAAGAKLAGLRRETMSRLVNRTDEGQDATPAFGADRRDPRQIEMFEC